MLSGSNITLVVTGSIAAYKSAELVRELVKMGAKVRVVMSKAAQQFITPLTLQTLSQERVSSDMFDEVQEGTIGHIKLADEADLVLVAPATANEIAKMAHGLADDLASATLLATTAPVLIAPAMNVNMWENEVTQNNVAALKARGVTFVGPSEGELACGWIGRGRLAEIAEIIDAAECLLTPHDLVGSCVVVTAGPTREMLDPVRFISNRSSGKMGYALARSAVRRGATVELITGPTNLTPPFGCRVHRVNSALEMRTELLRVVESLPEAETRVANFVFMVAAVTDFRPKNASPTKMKSNKQEEIALTLSPNPDIVGELGAERRNIEKRKGIDLKLVGFSVETGDLDEMLVAARGKLSAKKLDMIVANFAEEAFEKDTNRVWVLDVHGRQEAFTLSDKQSIAEKILSAALRL